MSGQHLVFPSNKNQILKIHLERIGLFLKKKKNGGGVAESICQLQYYRHLKTDKVMSEKMRKVSMREP